MRAARWNWTAMRGTPLALKFARRDLPQLDAVVKLTPQRRVCMQAGGSLGVWPRRLAESFAQVITCEPDHKNFARLMANIRAPNIQAYPVALGEQCGTVGICRARRDGNRKAQHDGCPHVFGPGSVPVETIDRFGLPVCDLIYLDVEGYELFALRGAVETLARCRPTVAVEINKYCGYYGYERDDIYTFMAAQGYVTGPSFGVDQVFLPQVPA